MMGSLGEGDAKNGCLNSLTYVSTPEWEFKVGWYISDKVFCQLSLQYHFSAKHVSFYCTAMMRQQNLQFGRTIVVLIVALTSSCKST